MSDELPKEIKNQVEDVYSLFVSRERRINKKVVRRIKKALWSGANAVHFIRAGFKVDELHRFILPVYHNMPQRFHEGRYRTIVSKRQTGGEAPHE